MFLGLPGPDPLVRGTVRIWIRIFPSSSKNSKKNLYFYCFVTSLWILIFEEWLNVPSKSTGNKQKKLDFLGCLEGHWQKEQDPEPDPNPLVKRAKDPRIRIRTNMSQIWTRYVPFTDKKLLNMGKSLAVDWFCYSVMSQNMFALKLTLQKGIKGIMPRDEYSF